MATFEVVIPKLGESVIEATLTKWLKGLGDVIREDEPIAEIATDKVDSEIISPVSGKMITQHFKEGDVVAVGAVISVIETNAGKEEGKTEPVGAGKVGEKATLVDAKPEIPRDSSESTHIIEQKSIAETPADHSGTRFYSPLIRSIARRENIPFSELDSLKGTGKDDRLTKHDLLDYLSRRGTKELPKMATTEVTLSASPATEQIIPGDDRIVEMDRIRQLIANHMVRSIQTSPHVTSFIEADMLKVVTWREKNKAGFQKRENQKLTFTPIFIDAIARTVRDFPMVNVSVDGSKIIVHKNINIGMAVALPNNNLIVPVVRNAGDKNLSGLIKSVNDLAERARINKLVPDEVTGGTISLTNLGSFGTLMGTPIINQPQTAIVAVGAIKKRPVVVETPDGDVIAIRPVMMVSLTYDHRVIDGSLGGQFLARMVHYLENFDINQTV